MRIAGGLSKGISLKTFPGIKTRPAADSVREALFSCIGDRVAGARFVDLFAGSGAYGLEAWSRGASTGIFVEIDSNCVKNIRYNILSVAKSGQLDPSNMEVVRTDIFRWQNAEARSHSIVFADPPYSQLPGMHARLFKLAEGLLMAGGLFILEHPADMDMGQPGWGVLRQLGKRLGRGPAVSILEPDLVRKNRS